MTLSAVPLISLTAAPDTLAPALGESFRAFGFAMVRDHGIDAGLITRGWAAARAFFALPDEAKRAYAIAGLAGQRGYTPFGVEIAKGASARDLKEFWHVGREFGAGDPLAEVMPMNVWPGDVAEFRETMTTLYAAFEATGARVLAAIARDLGLPADWFVPAIAGGNSILRLLHYPPIADAPEGAIRAGAHADINLITLLLGAEEAGLQLQTRDGDWVDVSPPEGALVVNIGDMLQRLTNGRLPSTPHRVVNPAASRAGHSRYSMPFFLHLRPDFVITPPAECLAPGETPREPPITAQAYLDERLREIGLM